MLFGSMLAGNFLNLPERVVSPFHQPSEREQPLSAGIPGLYNWWPDFVDLHYKSRCLKSNRV